MSEKKSLVAKLAEVMAAVDRIPKRGRNNFHNYDYATEADIVSAIRQELASRQVMLIPAITGMQRDPVGEKGSVLTTLTMQFTFRDGESGDEITRPWLGAGTDKEDKGAYKAMTGGEKYFLLKTFLIPTGDDPEQHDDRADKRERATVKPDAAAKRVRPALPDGFIYIDKVVPRAKGNSEWAEVVTSAGEEIIASIPALITLATNLVQENAPVRLTTHQNAKGRSQLDAIERWQSAVLNDAMEAAKPNSQHVTAAEVAF